MGIIDQLRAVASMPSRYSAVSLASPWAPHPSHLASVVYADVYGQRPAAALTRAEAMSVPAVARARHLIAGTIARLPLRVYRGETPVETPLWIDRTDAELSPFHRMLWTIDDLLFYGWSLWSIRRGADGVLFANRVPFDDWQFETDAATGRTTITLHGAPAAADAVALIPGAHEGLLEFAGRAVRHASMLVDAADRAAETPTPNVELHQTTDAPLTPAEIETLVAQWSAARRGRNGGVAYTNKAIEAKFHGEISASLLIDGRNAAAVDIARAVGIPASMIDATGPSASLTYETSQGRNAEFVDYGLAPYMAAVTARLGMDDLCPRGHRVEFDLERFTNSSLTSLATQDDDAGDTGAPTAGAPTAPARAPAGAPAAPPAGAPTSRGGR
ncbi:portal protein [Gordonia phage SallySpecial]|uniref:Portal protein n=1 Tax=Gordonia phage SallySpecial TaxID=2079570 RepID=A0A2P1CBY9_9CAUD|nr:portal protein [Gordonia phage SallySpecial]AVJ48752.1 portal protein [Gordonia phage SallySpecial]